MMKVRVIDLESLFEEPRENGLCEVGFTDVIAGNRDLLGEPMDWHVGETWSSLLDPKQPIPPVTSAVHHIIDADVRGAPSWGEVIPHVFGEDVIAYAAHGASFEKAWLGDLTNGKPWIDTYRCALWLHPESETHSNSGLRYYLRPEGLVREKADPAHRAGPDSYVTAFHIRDFLNAGNSVQQLIKWTENPAPIPTCKIGDYRNGGKGTPWPDVEDSMLRWILSKDFGEDIVFTVRREMERREVDRRIERERRDLERQFANNGMATIPPQPTSGRDFPPIEAYEGVFQ